jgi:hypothetical protein
MTEYGGINRQGHDVKVGERGDYRSRPPHERVDDDCRNLQPS